MLRRFVCGIGFSIAFAAACGGDGGSGPGPTPTTLTISGGNDQVAPASTALPTPLSVLVTDDLGQPVANVPISWAVGVGGGAVSDGGAVSATTSTTTNASGIASITRILGPNAGTQTTVASRAGLTGSPRTFSATAQIQGATQMALAPTGSGNGQTDTVLVTLPAPYRVLVRDQNNAAVQGVVVDWSVTTGGGAVSDPTSTTDASGIAEITHTFGSQAGNQSVRASVTGLAGSPVTFTSTANPGNAVSVEVAGGDNQTGSTNSTLATPYSVRAEDAYGNPKPGVAVDWAVHAGSGSLNPTQSTTGTNGIATSARTLGGTEGTYTDTATATGLTGSPLLFTVTAVTAPGTADVSVQNNVFVPDAVTVAPSGTVTWTWNSGVVSHNVTFEDGTGNSTTKNSGTHQRTFQTAGTYRYRCTIHSVNFTTGMVGTVAVP